MTEPDIERPIDLTDTPESEGPPVTPEHHPDDTGVPGSDPNNPVPFDPSVD